MNATDSIRQFVVVVLRRLSRDRTSLFFMIVLPVIVIVIIGVTFGSAGNIQIGVVNAAPGSAEASSIIASIDRTDGATVKMYDTVDELRGAVRRQSISAGVVLPADLEAAVADGTVKIDLIALQNGQSTIVARDVLISSAAVVLAPADAARFAAGVTGADISSTQAMAAKVGSLIRGVSVETVNVGKPQQSGLSRFSLVAPQELVLFVFINSLASGAALVRMRRTGVLRRVLAGPGGTGTIVLGLLAAWLIVSLLQSVLILAIGAIAFGVSWGSPIGAAALVFVFAVVGSSGGLIVGAIGGNEDRVGAITPPIGLVLGALGGCMVPLEVFSPTMRAVAHAVPQSWAMTAWQRLIFDGDGISGIVGPLLVLSAFAAVFLTGAIFVLRRSLTRS